MKWVSVKDKLPPDGVCVLVYDENKPVPDIDEWHHYKDRPYEFANYRSAGISTYSDAPYPAEWEANNCCDYGTPTPTHWMFMKDISRPGESDEVD
jgi:hypothetical protein